MKKYKILISVLSLIVILLSISVVASGESEYIMRISDDYLSIEVDGQRYVRVRNWLDGVIFDQETYISEVIEYTEKQENDIQSVSTWAGDHSYRLFITFKEGGNITEYYVREDMIDEYNLVASLQGSLYSTTFFHDQPDVIMGKDILFGESISVSVSEFMTLRKYLVFNTCDQIDFKKESGLMATDFDGNCYYFDYRENSYDPEIHTELDLQNVILHKVNSSLIHDSMVEEEEERSFGFIYTTIVLAFLFLCILPLGFVIFCIIKHKKAKQPYKTVYKLAAAIGIALIVVFMIICTMVLPYI